ncbi:MAG TPA: trypsin-like peptidase domain-containing protein [Dehalococcoidia bacterium]|nr:trypsin-like peptidase domain-containing protein [Dehalococcoidia bacterium]
MVLALALGLGAGFVGGLVAVQFDSDEPAAVVTPAAPTAIATEAPADDIRTAIQSALPAVVTVLVDFAPELLEDGRIRERRSVGSGFVINDLGHIVTNFHVIDGAQAITVILGTGEERPAVIAGHDSPFTDLAVLQIASQGLRSARFGDSDALVMGDVVAAVSGTLLGTTFDPSVSTGVVSALGRSWPRNGVILEDLVQTNVAVNHGDSGGALIDVHGDVIGLLTTVVRSDPSGLAVQGVAFAQSANSLRMIVESIAARGSFLRPRPGIERPNLQHIEISPELAATEGLPVTFGALIIEPRAGSPAEAAGIRAGDIVVGMNGIAVDFDNPLPNLLKRLSPGATADFFVLRNGRELLIPVSPWLE